LKKNAVGNAAHPVGCDSPLQILMAVWCTFLKFELVGLGVVPFIFKITTDLGETSEGGGSRDAVPTAAAAVAVTDHPAVILLRPKTMKRTHAYVFFYL
jgi:hypothetical protein